MNREELNKILDELLIKRGEHPSRVRNPLYGEERQLALDLVSEYTKPKTKKKSLEERYTDFHDKLNEYVGEYTHEMVVKFVGYWTEHNEGGRIMRFEYKHNQPFNIKRRLVTWKSRQKTTNKTTESKSDTANNWLKK